MIEILENLDSEVQKQLQKSPFPEWIDPMLATLTKDYFSDPDWIYERKLDGERCLAYKNGKQIRLLSRNQQTLNKQYPELVDALSAQDTSQFVVDGEVVAFKGNVTSFSRLQKRMHVDDPQEASNTGVAVYYYIFDIPYLDGYDLSDVEQRVRKKILKAALSFADPLRYVTHRNRIGKEYFRQACQKGWEGVIAKKADARYVHSRSSHWLKFKCVNRQEFVIGGYTDPEGSRIGFGALLLGYYQGDELAYAGKVGTGFDEDTLKRLGKRLSSLEKDSPPFSSQADLPHQAIHWVKPQLVAQIGFEEWTASGKLRQPRYQGLRQDKDPKEVVKEEPQ